MSTISEKSNVEILKLLQDRFGSMSQTKAADNTKSTMTQRALVLQGGGAIAAYEAGIYSALYFWLKKDRANDGKNLFDIVAGTSGGAINASIIVSQVQQNRRNGLGVTDSWKGTVRRVLDFWNYVVSDPDLSNWWPYYKDRSLWLSTWQDRHKIDDKVATSEAARRYYSAKESLYSGVPNVFLQSSVEQDNRFFDDLYPVVNNWYHYSNKPLKDSIKKYASFPIRTSYADGGAGTPRLLMVSVDVGYGETITFDSYEKDGASGLRKTEYGWNKDLKAYDYTISYEGIMPEHVFASSSVPVNYDYAEIEVEEIDRTHLVKAFGNADKNNSDNQGHSKVNRKFWDGGIISNTPLRELIQAHQHYWTYVRKQPDNIPNLEVYIVNVWPKIKDSIVPSDHDGEQDRKNDFIYQDKTLYEEKVSAIIRDYINLARKLMDKAPSQEVQKILNEDATSTERTGKRRKYRNLIQTFQITEIIRIERQSDMSDVSYKWCDFSYTSISHLIRSGMRDTLLELSLATKSKPGANPIDLLNKLIDLLDSEKKSEFLAESLDKIFADESKTPADVLKAEALNIKAIV